MNLNQFKNLKTPYILILVGPPLVGKSFFCSKFLNKIDNSATLISRDAIVMEVAGTDNYNHAFNTVDQKEVNRQLEYKIEQAVKNKQNVVVDMTNLTSKRRKSTLAYFTDDYTKIAVLFPMLSEEEFKERNKKRELEENKTIPEGVIRNMIASYQRIDKNSEGFDKIISL